MSNEDLGLMVNLRTLVKDGWTVMMETGLRGGELRSWVTLQHFERAEKHKVRSMSADLQTALMSAMKQAGIEPWDPKAKRAACTCPIGTSIINCPVHGEHQSEPLHDH